MVDPPDNADPILLLLHRDLRQAIFAQLYVAATHEEELLPVIKQWEESFLSDDRIPLIENDHKLTHRVRALARRFIQEMVREQGLGLDGREML
jgi:hypothetical protein